MTRPLSAPATVLATAVALLAFASNSVLCRLALGRGIIDPVSYTAVRLAAGALVLAGIAYATRGDRPRERVVGAWQAALALFGYAACFSLAYVTLPTGTGALILFSSVQITMMGSGLLAGERPTPAQWTGVVAATAGLAYLLVPGIAAPDPLGAVSMIVAGVSWGIYSLLGRRAGDPLRRTAGAFVRATPMIAVVALVPVVDLHGTGGGILLAVASGAIASGLGYVVWYVALRGLTATAAATVQLPVPVLSAIGGVLVLGEAPTLRLAVASVVILGGVALAIGAGARRRPQSSTPGGASRA